MVLLALLVIAVVGIPHPEAAAESVPQFINMSISVMPEYDQPAVLVAYQGQLNSDVPLPMQVRLRLPADTVIEHVCSITAAGEHQCQPYSTQPDGEYLALTYETVTPIIYVELYYGSVSGAGQRSLDFTFWPPYPVQSLDVMVQEPLQATDFALTPAAANTMEEGGFRHHLYTFQDLPVDKPVGIQMTYSRETGQPSVPPRAVAATGSGDGGGIPQPVIVFLGLAGAATLGFILYRAFGRRFRVRLVALAQAAPGNEAAAPQAGTFFCRHCGHRLRRGFTFCPECGQEVHLPQQE